MSRSLLLLMLLLGVFSALTQAQESTSTPLERYFFDSVPMIEVSPAYLPFLPLLLPSLLLLLFCSSPELWFSSHSHWVFLSSSSSFLLFFSLPMFPVLVFYILSTHSHTHTHTHTHIMCIYIHIHSHMYARFLFALSHSLSLLSLTHYLSLYRW
jgi:hypothetical protein